MTGRHPVCIDAGWVRKTKGNHLYSAFCYGIKMDSLYRGIMEDGRIDGVCPCDKCEHTQVCKEQEWACRPFASFVWSNYFYEHTPRIPCRGTFNKIFNVRDNQELKDFLHKQKNEYTDKDNEGK